VDEPAHYARRLVQAEQLGAVPAFGFAGRPQRAFGACGRAARLGEAAGDDVLQAQQLLAALLFGDVAAHAAIAGKAVPGVEHRLAAHADVAPVAVVEVAPHEHFAERLPRL
jgi:hypothetical protein